MPPLLRQLKHPSTPTVPGLEAGLPEELAKTVAGALRFLCLTICPQGDPLEVFKNLKVDCDALAIRVGKEGNVQDLTPYFSAVQDDAEGLTFALASAKAAWGDVGDYLVDNHAKELSDAAQALPTKFFELAKDGEPKVGIFLDDRAAQVCFLLHLADQEKRKAMEGKEAIELNDSKAVEKALKDFRSDKWPAWRVATTVRTFADFFIGNQEAFQTTGLDWHSDYIGLMTAMVKAYDPKTPAKMDVPTKHFNVDNYLLMSKVEKCDPPTRDLLVSRLDKELKAEFLKLEKGQGRLADLLSELLGDELLKGKHVERRMCLTWALSNMMKEDPMFAVLPRKVDELVERLKSNGKFKAYLLSVAQYVNGYGTTPPSLKKMFEDAYVMDPKDPNKNPPRIIEKALLTHFIQTRRNNVNETANLDAHSKKMNIPTFGELTHFEQIWTIVPDLRTKAQLDQLDAKLRAEVDKHLNLPTSTSTPPTLQTAINAFPGVEPFMEAVVAAGDSHEAFQKAVWAAPVPASLNSVKKEALAYALKKAGCEQTDDSLISELQKPEVKALLEKRAAAYEECRRKSMKNNDFVELVAGENLLIVCRSVLNVLPKQPVEWVYPVLFGTVFGWLQEEADITDEEVAELNKDRAKMTSTLR